MRRRVSSPIGRALSLVVACVLIGTAAAPAGGDDPHAMADARFENMNGPMAQFVVTPDKFGIDASKTLTDVPPLLSMVDPARLRANTTELAGLFRSSESPQPQLDAATNWVVDKFTGLGYEPELQPVTYDDKSMPNVSVTIPGTGCADRVLVLSAHYDAKGPENPGADDDATGIAGLLEVARILRERPQPVTIRLVAFSFEEDGLVGSSLMARLDRDVDTDIVGAVSMDMIGYTEPETTDPFIGEPADYLAMVADPDSAVLARTFGAAVFTYTPEFPAAGAVIDPDVLPDIFRSDHAPFVAQGYPGMIVTDTANFRNPNYHTPNDTLDTIDWDFVTGSTKAVLAGMVTYASSDQDANHIADLCPGGLVTTTTTAPSPPQTSPPVAPAPAPAATPVASRPAYTG